MQTIYFIIFAIVVLLSFLDFRETDGQIKRILYIVIGAVLFFYSGLKDGDYVSDYKSYEFMYDQEIYIVEPTFTLISLLTRYVLGNNVIWIFVIYALIGTWLKFIAFKKLTPLLFSSILIFVSDYYVLQDITQIRAAVSTGIFLLAIPSLHERNGKRYALFTIVALLFHVSSILMLLVWFLKPDRINKLFWLSLMILGYLLALIKIDIVTLIFKLPLGVERFQLYLEQQADGDFTANVFSLMFLSKLLLSCILLWKAELIVRNNQYGYLLLKTMFVSLFSLLLFSQNLAAGLRVSEFLGVVSIVLFPMLCYIVTPRWAAWIILLIISCGFVAVRIFSMNLISNEPIVL